MRSSNLTLVLTIICALFLMPVSIQVKAVASPSAFSCTSVTDVPVSECEALVAFFNSTDGENWVSNYNWLVTTTVDDWNGVTVSGGHVTQLFLFNNGLNGSLPADMGNLPALQAIYLHRNMLSGSIPPNMGKLASLEELALSSNLLSGSLPAELGNLSALRMLTVENNQLTGSIPSMLGNLSSLESLNFRYNLFSGSIPSQLGNLSSLLFLSIHHNQLTGIIPAALGNLSALTLLELGENQLSGAIPPELGKLTNLTYLSISVNQLDGGIPVELANLVAIQELRLSSNQLSGNIPPEIGSLSSLRVLDLFYNQLSGNIPSQLGNLTTLEELHLGINNLSGSIPPELGNLSALKGINLEANQLSGNIPPELGNLNSLNELNLAGNQLTGTIPLELSNLANLWYLRLDFNQLSGSIPLELANLPLYALELEYNQLSGSIPPELGNLVNLWKLDLSGNQLSGSIPSELGKLTALSELSFFNNPLTGSIPLAFINLTQLDYFTFGYTFLCEPDTPEYIAWVATIENYYRGTDTVCNPWTIMVYNAGDNEPNMESIVSREMLNLRIASANPNAQIVNFFDGVNVGAYYNSLLPDGGVKIELGEVNTGDPETLRNFVLWARENYPAQHYALVISDHGHGLKGIAWDHHTGIDSIDNLTPVEIQEALRDTGKLDVIYSNACMMGNIESAYEVRNLGDYYVASEAKTWGVARFDWAILGNETHQIPALSSETTGLQFAQALADSYVAAHSSSISPSNIAVIRLDQVEALAQETSQLAEILRSTLPGSLLLLNDVHSDVQRFEETNDDKVTSADRLADLYHFAELVNDRSGNPEVQHGAQNVMDAVNEAVYAVHAWDGIPDGRSGEEYYWDYSTNSHGISIFFPRFVFLRSYYEGEFLNFAAGTTWEFPSFSMQATHAAGVIQWGPMLTDAVYYTDPNAPEDPNPPELSMPLMLPGFSIHLPLIIR